MILPRPLEGMLVGMILFLMWYPFSFRKNKFFRNLCIASLFVYVGAVVSLTMIYAPPWNWNISKNHTTYALSCVTLTPFESSIQIFRNCQSSGDYFDFIWLIGGNIIMLMPLGILVPLINPKYGIIRITILAATVSLSVELLQLSSNLLLGRVLRAVEIDDFIQNTVGCILAYVVFYLMRAMYYRIKIKPQKQKGESL